MQFYLVYLFFIKKQVCFFYEKVSLINLECIVCLCVQCVVFVVYYFFGGFNCDCCIMVIGVCIDCFVEFFVQWCVIYQNYIVFVDVLFDYCVDYDFYVRYGGGQQGGYVQDVWFFCFKCFEIVFDGVVDVQINNFKVCVFYYYIDKVFVDVVDVVFDGVDDYFINMRCVGFS